MKNLDASYQKSLDFLYSFIDYSLTRAFRYSPEKFNLERMRILLKRLGDPQTKYRIIHIAGTKGKGSVSALIARALQYAGYKTGLYSSPMGWIYLKTISFRWSMNLKLTLNMYLRSLHLS